MAQGGSNGPWGKRNEWEELLSRLPTLPKFLSAGIPTVILIVIVGIWAASGIYDRDLGQNAAI